VLLSARLDVLRGKSVGLITNHTSVLPDGRSLVTTLRENGIQLKALFAPEHGFLGLAEAGEKTEDTSDALTGITVFSLYGKTRKPTAEMLRGIDVLIFDIQDIGVRFYTYISTMGLAMEAAGEAGIPFVVLDRPNPQGGSRIEGPMMDDSLRSFVGLFPIPVVYGLTCGELALMIAGEAWLYNDVRPEVHVIPMKGWKREMNWEATGLPWRAPSPNIPDPETAILYPATCYLEATEVSEGRGTKEPFRLIGAPFIDAAVLSDALKDAVPAGIRFIPISFVPEGSKHKGMKCNGTRLEVTDSDVFRASETGLGLLTTLLRLYPSETGIRKSGLERLIGSAQLVERLLAGQSLSTTLPLLDQGIDEFRRKREQYLLYP
jgi:uncharacterized protein YbbC (DUF1343 family)